MGCFPSKSTARNYAEPEMQYRQASVTSTQKLRPSSAEHLAAPYPPDVTVAPKPPLNPNCIAPRRHFSQATPVDHANDHGHGQAAAIGVAGAVAVGAAVIGGEAAFGGGADAGGGGGDAGGGDGGGGGE